MIKTRLKKITDWWHKPVSKKDRKKAAAVGFFGGFWLTLILFLFLAKGTTGLLILLCWMLAGAVFSAVLGFVFPKIVLIVLYPFSMFNVGC